MKGFSKGVTEVYNKATPLDIASCSLVDGLAYIKLPYVRETTVMWEVQVGKALALGYAEGEFQNGLNYVNIRNSH